MKTNKIYSKHNSFSQIYSSKAVFFEKIKKKILTLISEEKSLNNFSDYEKNILTKVRIDLLEQKDLKSHQSMKFSIKENILDEIIVLNSQNLLKYLIHRYQYEIFPQEKVITEYPPLLQIEPSSFCNYRCVFCFMTDNTFNKKSSGHMGKMGFETYKKIIDQIENKIEFVTLASRGEPFACPDIIKMLNYSSGKFLNFKINTNASLLDEKKIHALLSGAVTTLVISADAADKELYSKLRVNGELSKVIKNIELFNKIKNTHYSDNKIVTRVSGVKISNKQNFADMTKTWGGLVDQVAFVDYNPWENCYEAQENDLETPCSDLWRRMFVWWDGIVNPCDVDYKSNLKVGNIDDKTISQIWNGKKYNELRSNHLLKLRKNHSPCKSCYVV